MWNKNNTKKKEKIKGFGEKFFLEEWEVCEKTNLYKPRTSLQFHQNLLVSKLKKIHMKIILL